MSTITLTTDFGTQDWFVGTMKGVILGLCPKAVVVDITHDLLPGDIRSGAFALAASYRYFPKGTVHVAVVDPGVGSSRLAIAVETADYLFVGPDNGVLSFALAREKIKAVRRLENKKCFLQPVSSTFHGRDVFAPVAARLCCGLAIQKLGPVHRDLVRLSWPEPSVGKAELRGTIVYVDRFGNLITNLREDLLRNLAASSMRIRAGRASAISMATHYAAVPKGRPAALIGSSGLLEIAVNGDSAARKLKLTVGDPIQVRLSRPNKTSN
ncbi:conserved hypothetical protein [Verrucomicrobia bacterium]|nr:conserved hypothetical protein [Verrucomicrobiota bacterium]